MFETLGCESTGRWVGCVVFYLWAVGRAAPRCVCALDVGGLVPTPTYICLAVCDLEGRGVEFGRWGV